MRRRWTIETKRALIENAKKFKGSRSEYLKKAGVAPSQFYRFARELRVDVQIPARPRLVQLIGATGGPSIELFFPSGHRLRFTGLDPAAVLSDVFQQLSTIR